MSARGLTVGVFLHEIFTFEILEKFLNEISLICNILVSSIQHMIQCFYRLYSI